MRFLGIVSDVFLDYANGLNRGYSVGHTDHPVLSRDTKKLIMDGEAIFEAFNPAQTGGIVVNANWVFVRFTVYS